MNEEDWNNWMNYYDFERVSELPIVSCDSRKRMGISNQKEFESEWDTFAYRKGNWRIYIMKRTYFP